MLPLVHVLNKWEFYILVVLSFTLQVILLLVGGIRRRKPSYALRIFLWLVYLSADSTATYTLGLMASSCQNSGLHQLEAFWAPFLLLHLGGQDTVTAYAIEDNELWLRHLFILVVQAFGAAYILYKYLSAGDRFLIPASILVFVVGVVKYGERIWSLKCASMSSMQGPFILSDEVTNYLMQWAGEYESNGSFVEYRSITDTALVALQFSKRLFVTPSISSEWRRPTDYLNHGFGPSGQLYSSIIGCARRFPWVGLNRLYRTVDLELSLMYDLFYTKSAVIHTWYGYIIRALSFLAILSSLVLFIMSRHSRYIRGDVAVTYVLLVGAFVLEIFSIVRVIGSTWAYAYLDDPSSGPNNKTRRFAETVLSLHWQLGLRLDLWPTNCIGQYNIICTVTSRDIRWKIVKLIRQEDWWTKAHHSKFIQAPEAVVQAIYTEVQRRATLFRWTLMELDHNIHQGRWTTRGSQKLEELSPKIHERGLTGFILVCHIATDIFVHCCDQDNMSQTARDLRQVAMVLSNYMTYLLRVHPDILPTVPTQANDTWDKTRYDEVFDNNFTAILDSIIRQMQVEIEQDGARPQDQLLTIGRAVNSEHGDVDLWGVLNSVYVHGSCLAARLLETTEVNLERDFQFLIGLWVDTLLYVTDGITANFHAKQLSYGGEFVTFVSLLMANVGLHMEKFWEQERRYLYPQTS